MTKILWLRASLISKVVVYTLLALAAVITLLPFLWASINSIKTSTATFEPHAFIPFLNFEPTLDSWRNVLSDPQAINAFISSVVVSVGTTVFALILGVPAAYALARFQFPIRSGDIALWFLSQRVLPPAVVLVPFYLLMVSLRLVDTWIGLILCYSAFNLAFAVVIMRDIFRDVSTEIEDAAKVEGATPWQIFWKISLPLSVDGLIVTAVLVFAFTWNEALFASALTSQSATTFSALVLASRSTRGVDFNIAAVNTLIGIVPPVILYFFVQRYLARGLSFGAVKG
ncbi:MULTISPECIES: carbohydrate ABC transporter permease [unclassified Bradyrhizobium]|uniref:carbohydrate ABC transporter permease n=1 Tax=unclassified Bradyrhizobium TaxID=2631580 RepID=UPI0003F76CD2|nr:MULTISPECIES: carbohydrate ABC transporter permease [unclassified Bradyrhizobium]MCP3459405.1 carbohydrate ABC transporter permease [Bradyrhizobium sp. CCGUVB23]